MDIGKLVKKKAQTIAWVLVTIFADWSAAHAATLQNFAISADEHIVNGFAQTGVVFLDLATGKDVAFVNSGSWDKVAGVLVSPDSTRAFVYSRGGPSSSYGYYATIDLTGATPRLLARVEARNSATGAQAFVGQTTPVITPDSRYAISADVRTVSGVPGVVFVDLATGKDVAFVDMGSWDKPAGVLVSPDGTRAFVYSRGGPSSSYGYYATIDLTGATPRLLARVEARNSTTGARALVGQTTPVITPDSRYAISADERTVNGLTPTGVVFLDLATGKDVAFVDTGSWDTRPAGVLVSPDGTRAFVYSRGGYNSNYGYYATINLTGATPTLLAKVEARNSTTGAQAVLGQADPAITPDSRYAISADERTVNGLTPTGVVFLDLATGKDVAFVATGSWDKRPAGVLVSPDSARAFVYSRGGYNSNAGYYATLDLTGATPTLLAKVEARNSTTGVQAVLGQADPAITTDSRYAISADERTVNGLTPTGVVFLDLATGKDVAFVATGSWDTRPSGVLISADGTRAFVYNRGGYNSNYGYYATLDLTGATPTLLAKVEARNSTTGAQALLGQTKPVLTPGINANHAPVANAGTDLSVIICSGPSARVTLDGSASTDPDGDSLTYSWTGPFGTVTGATPTVDLGLGTHTIVLTVQDGNGGTSTDTLLVTVAADNIPPSIQVQDAIVEATGPAGAPYQGQYTASDNCGPVGVSSTPVLTVYPLGATLVTWTATDAAGNGSTAIQTITVVDTTAPLITVAKPAVTGMLGAVDLGLVTATDIVDGICGPASLCTLTNNAPIGFPLGTTTVVWTATDSSGNSSNASQTVTIKTPAEVIGAIGTIISAIPPGDLNNSNNANAFLNKLDAVLGSINSGNYSAALSKIQADLLPKTDGCATGGAVDNNDWVTTCGSQAQLYPAITQLAAWLQLLI